MGISDINPGTKLDADNYAAEDLDGTTESLFGSGNLNYLTLQSQQNDLMAQQAGIAEGNLQEVSLANLASGITAGHGASALAAGHYETSLLQNGDEVSGLTEYASTDPQGITALIPDRIRTDGEAGGGSDGRDSTSDEVYNSASTLSETAVNGSNGDNGNNGNAGVPGANGSNGNDGNDGRDGTNPPPPGGGDDVDIHIDTDITGPVNLNPVIDVILDPVETIVGDIDVIVGTDLNLDEITDAVTDTLNNPLDTINNVLDGITGVVNGLLPAPADGDADLHLDLGLAGPLNANPIIDVLLDPVEQIVGDIDINVLPDVDIGAGTLDLDLDAVVANLPIVNTSLHLAPPALTEAADLMTELPGLDEILQDPADAVSGVVENLQDAVGGILAGGDTEGSENTDLQIDLGLLPPVDVSLDPLETITGDIDLDLTNQLDLNDVPGTVEDIAGNVTDLAEGIASGDPQQTLENMTDFITGSDTIGSLAEGAVNAVEELLGDPEGLTEDLNPLNAVTDIANGGGLETLLNGGPDNGDAADDTDLAIDPSLDVLGIETPDVEVAAVLDPVESVIGDVDIDIDAAIDALNGGGAEDLLTIGGSSTGTGEGGIWPENPVNGAVDTVFDAALGGGDGASALPDPSGTVAEGLGILNLVDTGGGGGNQGLLGGLFG